MDPVISEFQQNSEKTILYLKDDLKSIRTGRASPSLVENLIVETYGGQAKLKLYELASISTEGPTTLVIAPFDPSIITDVEKAILKSPLGISPQTQGNRIFLRLPSMSADQRVKMNKLVNQKIEEKKVAVRGFRDETRRKIKLSFEKKEITEDNKYRLEKEVDNLTQKQMEELDRVKNNKEREINEI